MAGVPGSGIEEFLYIPQYWADRLASRAMRTTRALQTEDLFQAGCVGLLEAWEKYDECLGITFIAYANPRVHGAVIDEIRAMDPLRRGQRTRLREQEARDATGKGQPEGVERELSFRLESFEELQEWLSEHRAAIDKEAVNPLEKVIDLETERIVKLAIKRMSAPDAEILRLYYWEQWPLWWIAKHQNIALSTVSLRRIAAEKKLETALRMVA